MNSFRLRVALVMAVVVVAAPFAQLFGAAGCGVSTGSIPSTKSCPGCCAAMKCCKAGAHDESNEPLQSPTHGRLAASLETLSALSWQSSFLGLVQSDGRWEYRPQAGDFDKHEPPTLARLCTRLI